MENSDCKPGCANAFLPILKFLDFWNLERLQVVNIGQLIFPNALQNFNFTDDQFRRYYYLSSISKYDGARAKCNIISQLEINSWARMKLTVTASNYSQQKEPCLH